MGDVDEKLMSNLSTEIERDFHEIDARLERIEQAYATPSGHSHVQAHMKLIWSLYVRLGVLSHT
jgi:hypothetical protein